MSKVDLIINKILEDDRGQEISISVLRQELKENGELNEQEISFVCKAISNHQLNAFNHSNSLPFKLLSNVTLAYFLALAFIGLIMYAAYSLYFMHKLSSEFEIPTSMFVWRYFLLAGSLFFLTRNLHRIQKHLKAKI